MNNNNITVIGSINILFVDDDQICHDLIELTFDDIYTDKTKIFTMADCGESALQKVKNLTEKVDLLLLDFMLPDMTGYELYNKLQEYDVTKDVPVIFQTGLSTVKEDVKDLIEEGKAEIITKPYNKYDLLTAMVKLLD